MEIFFESIPRDLAIDNPTLTTQTKETQTLAQSFRDSLDEFLDQSIDLGEALPTKIEVVPECETRATITSITPRKWQNDDGEWRAIVEVMFTCTDPSIKEETGLDDPRARLTIFLDTPKTWNGEGNPPLEAGRNKNVALGRFLEGLGVNDGRKFKWSNFMHEDAWIRVVKPRTEQDMFSGVAMIGQDQESVKRTTRGRRAA